MKNILMKIFALVLLITMVNNIAFSQFNLKKLKDKAKEKIEKTAKKKVKETTSKATKKVTSKAKSTVTGNNSSSADSSKGIMKTKGKDYYVSQQNGKGRIGSKEQPARDLAVLISKLQSEDIVHIAVGTYTGKAGLSSDVLKVGISIIGGYSPDFSTRDPWGEYKTIFSGTNELKAATTSRISIKEKGMNKSIVIDGIIIDNAARNRYKGNKKLLILRTANMSKNENPSPERSPLRIFMGPNSKLVVRNCIILNAAPTGGVMDLQLSRGSEAYIENNLIINNTGEGLMLKAGYHKPDGMVKYHVKNNTILFTWKHDAIASYGGNSIMMDTYTEVLASDNVFGFGDMGGVNNVKKCKNLLLIHNLFIGHKKYDYKEFSTTLKLDEMADYADSINENSGNNFSKSVKIPISKEWAEIYFSRTNISRADVDAAAKVSNSGANQLRGMLGLPLQASSVKMDADVWLHKMEIGEAIQAGTSTYGGVGCQKPSINN